jgi:hypothetical protein
MLPASGACVLLQGLAFGMLKSTGTGVKFLRGSGFLIGRSVNSRRETRWSAPSYFHMDIRGLPPQFRGVCRRFARAARWHTSTPLTPLVNH